jgi:PelA/Pel-15E family pectate lyase
MKSLIILFLIAAVCLAVGAGATARRKSEADKTIKWDVCLEQKAEWYGGEDAVRIADNVLIYQRNSGGWPKNIDMAAELTEKARAELIGQKRNDDSTIDNGATYTQLAYLARVLNAVKRERFKESFLKGFDYLIAAQYENGGWPQYYPKLSGYYRRITFNDDAMIGVLSLLRDVARQRPAYGFVDESRRAAATKAVAKGIECILKCQVIVGGKRTAWCAQHDEVSFEPAPARSYEKISLSGSETAGVVRFLMGIDRPDAVTIDAIQSAVAWLDLVKLKGISLVEKPDPSLPKGYDKLVVADSNAKPIWARFYEIGSNRPIFSGRDGVVKYSLAEIEHERRIGYNWYVQTPAKLLEEDYPEWMKRWKSKS